MERGLTAFGFDWAYFVFFHDGCYETEPSFG